MSGIYTQSDTTVNEQDKTLALDPNPKGARIQSIRVEYIASADAGSRLLEVRYIKDSDVVWATEIVYDIVASDIIVVNLSPCAALLTPVDNGDEGSQHCAPGLSANGSVQVIATAGSNAADDMQVHVTYETVY